MPIVALMIGNLSHAANRAKILMLLPSLGAWHELDAFGNRQVVPASSQLGTGAQPGMAAIVCDAEKTDGPHSETHCCSRRFTFSLPVIATVATDGGENPDNAS